MSRVSESNAGPPAAHLARTRAAREGSPAPSPRAGAKAPSPALAEQQRWLYQAITNPTHACSGVEGHVRGGTLTPERRVDIYRHGYFQRLLECLRDDFPAVEMALGVEMFEGYGREYCVRHPPQSVSLNDFGARFPEHLRATAAAATACLPHWIAELAVLEWATVRAIHADATETLSGVDFGRVPSDAWGELQLTLSPSVQAFEFAHAINDCFTDARQARGADVRIEPPAARTSWILVCRNAQRVWRLDLDDWAYRLLEALRRGRALAEALEDVSASDGGVAEGAVSRCFQEWVACGVFSAFTLRRTS